MNPNAPVDLDNLVRLLTRFTQQSGEGQKTAFLTQHGLICAGTESGNSDFAIAVIYPEWWSQEDHQPGAMAMTCYSLISDVRVTSRAKHLAQEALDEVKAGRMQPIPVSI